MLGGAPLQAPTCTMSYDVFRLPFFLALGMERGPVRHEPLQSVSTIGRNNPEPTPRCNRITHSRRNWSAGPHFSNGLTFGVMYVALAGSAVARHWTWAALFCGRLELGMLLTPYSAFFGIPLTAKFVAVTLIAHLIFGVVMGRAAGEARGHDP